MYSVYFIKRSERSDTILRISAIRFLTQAPAAEAASLIEKEILALCY